jgi:hypothetical protein
MAEQPVSSVILDTLGLLFGAVRSVQWSRLVLGLGRLLAFPFKIFLLWPARFVGSVLLVVFSPLVLIFSYITSFISATVDLIISLEPFYTLFGSAAFIGIVAGITVGASSTFITSYLGMHNDASKELLQIRDDESDDTPLLLEESSSNEAEWQWLERSPARRRPAPSLLSQTIHEEEDDDNDSDVAF